MADSTKSISTVKKELMERLKNKTWFQGIGIALYQGERSIKVRVAYINEEVQRAIPQSVDGFSVVVEVVGKIVKRD